MSGSTRQENVFSECPTFFHACVMASRQGRTYDGYKVSGYDYAGWHLGSNVMGLIRGYLDGAAVEELLRALARSDEKIAWKWLRQHLPRCMELVPSSRRKSFMRGFLDAYREGRLG